MKILLCLLAVLPALRQVEYAHIELDAFPREVLIHYRNANFIQHVESRSGVLAAQTRSLNFLELDLTYRLDLEPETDLEPGVRSLAVQFLEPSITLKQYLMRIRDYMHSNIRYSPDSADQSPAAVLERGSADCVGMTRLVSAWLDAVGIAHQSISGFYFHRDIRGDWQPQPHRWLEIRLPDGFSFFFDPQHRIFSPRYLVVRPGVDFRRVRRFQVVRMNLQSKLENG